MLFLSGATWVTLCYSPPTYMWLNPRFPSSCMENATAPTKQPRNRRSILMIPWLAHGHISPFLQLAKKLSSHNFHILFCSTPVNLQSLPNPSPSDIEFVELNSPLSFPHLPPHHHTTRDLPPPLMQALVTTFDSSQPLFARILETLHPDAVIYDFLLPWVPSTARKHNIKAFLFVPTSVAVFAFLTLCCMNMSEEYPFPIFKFDRERCKELTKFLRYVANDIKVSDRVLDCIWGSSDAILIKASNEMEGKYVEYFSNLINKNVLTVGPLVQESEDRQGGDDERFMGWLDEKGAGSVSFISFGSECFLSRDEIEEVALGIEMSGVDFIWVVRCHGGEKKPSAVDELLPKGFLERVGNKGLVVEGWAPQVKILKHPSTGGFVSHCGWSSVNEAIVFGVPIIAAPMQYDQPFNARLVEDVGAGIPIQKDKSGRFGRVELAEVIREVMFGEERGRDVRRKVKELGERMKESQEDEIEDMVKRLEQLIG